MDDVSRRNTREICTFICVQLTAIEENVIRFKSLLYEYINSLRTKVPMHTSTLSGKQWLDELLNGHPVRCFNALRMNKDTFLLLCNILENKYYIDSRAKISSKERVALFLRTLSHRCANRDSMERFQHSGATISYHFGDILDVVGRMGRDFVRPRDVTYAAIPEQILKNKMYYPTFKDCIGALDGCHVELTVPEKKRIRFINRKGYTSTNVFAICDFDLLFVFVCAGWEGSAHDTRVYLNSVNDPSLAFPKPPPGKYYIGDKGYPDREGLLTPHTKVKYHQSEFRSQGVSGNKEMFNKVHSSLRSAIERSFGVLKSRWQILRKVPSYPLVKQIKIVNACFTLHNFTRVSSFGDPCFYLMDRAPTFIPDEESVDDTDVRGVPLASAASGVAADNGTRDMVLLKERLTANMFVRRVRQRHH